jgi:hypothetical protein
MEQQQADQVIRELVREFFRQREESAELAKANLEGQNDKANHADESKKNEQLKEKTDDMTAFTTNNQHEAPGEIDLEQLTVTEAIEMLKKQIQFVEEMQMQELTANGGQGHHSKSEAKLRPVVERSEKEENIELQLDPETLRRISFEGAKDKRKDDTTPQPPITPKNPEPKTKTQVSIEMPNNRRVPYTTRRYKTYWCLKMFAIVILLVVIFAHIQLFFAFKSRDTEFY